MPIYLLGEEPELFPPPEKADRGGLLAVGGDLSPERLLSAYSQGIFPWYSQGQPILWHSPDPRFVLEPDKLHVGRSLRKTMGRGDYEVRYDTAFRRAGRRRVAVESTRPNRLTVVLVGAGDASVASVTMISALSERMNCPCTGADPRICFASRAVIE